MHALATLTLFNETLKSFKIHQFPELAGHNDENEEITQLDHLDSL